MLAANKTVLRAAATITTDTTTTGSASLLHYHTRSLILVSTVSARSAGTFTTTLQHSPDGSTWTNVLMSDGSTAFACAAQSANGVVYKYLLEDVPVFQYVRASILSASSASATVEVVLYTGVSR
jgi:hypothetical protein